jgi:hypothetical protein
MPAFARFPVEGAIIGRLLSGYGDLEFDLCHCVAMAANDLDMVLKAMFRVRGETQRIDIADAIGRKPYRALNLETQFSETVAGAHHCRKIRNQFSHCNWMDDNTGELAFVDLQEIALEHAIVDITALTAQHVTPDLLRQQEEFFGYISDCLAFLNHEAQRMAGRLTSHTFAMPPKMAPPLLRKP